MTQNCWRPQIIFSQIHEALKSAGELHHGIEDEYFEGKRDESWPLWYAGYVMSYIPLMKDSISASKLLDCIWNTPEGYGGHDDWFDQATQYILDNMTINCLV